MTRILWMVLLIFIILFAGCGFRADRCWVDDYRYGSAKEIYEKTQTLELVKYYLENQHSWRRCEINEVLYRLKKEYHLDESLSK